MTVSTNDLDELAEQAVRDQQLNRNPDALAFILLSGLKSKKERQGKKVDFGPEHVLALKFKLEARGCSDPIKTYEQPHVIAIVEEPDLYRNSFEARRLIQKKR